MIGDNAAPLPDWSVQPTRHCGQFCFDRACRICGEWVPAYEPDPTPHTLGEN